VEDVRIDPSEDRRRRVQRAILMHGTSPRREEVARLLARLVFEADCSGAAFGKADAGGRSTLAPVHAISTSATVRWDAKLPGTFVRVVGRERVTAWYLMVRGVDQERLDRTGPLLSLVIESLARAGSQDRPTIPPLVDAGPYGRFLEALDAYRLAGFSLGRKSAGEFLRGELRQAFGRRPSGSALAVLLAAADPERLSVALSDFGHDLEDSGNLREAAAVFVILYELALLRADADVGIDAARWAGRAFRKIADWPQALAWYGLARRLSEHEGDFLRLVRVLDGIGNTHRERGAFPKARQCYRDAWKVAQVARNPIETANVALGLMTVEREAGRWESAASFGWTALGLQSDRAERANLLLNIGTLLRDGGDLEAAERAYRVTAILAEASDVRLMARDALAYCAALAGDANAYAMLRPRARGVPPYLRAQIGYFRGAALMALDDPRARRVLRATERYAREHGLAEWEIKAARLRDRPMPATTRVVRTPAAVTRGLRELENALA
jgi:tetratricopeptide (TPR) repeat protein